MTIKDLKESITVDDVRTLLDLMGATISYEDENIWISNTICHQGTKQKLYFYKDSKTFYCYSECGYLDVIELVKQVNDIEKSYDAMNWICIKLNIDNCEYGFGKQEQLDDWKFINKLKYKKNKKSQTEKELSKVPISTLNMFQKLYYSGWIEEGISIRSMRKHDILYSTWQQRIVIPHFNKNGDLVGIRGRSLIPSDVELFGKYSPLLTGGTKDKFFNHELGLNLYGLDKNLTTIKRKRKIMLVESEKSVLQCDTMFGDDNFVVALCGSNLTKQHVKLILDLNPLEVIIGLDKQWKEVDDHEYEKWKKKIRDKFITPLAPYTKVSVLWDVNNYLDYKDSPTDKGYDILLKLMDEKIYGQTLNN